ncbi:MAG TPA: DNA repair protein RecN [Candidatus Hydrogenedens sp.]|nr:DNA repair protein RecN [Candidatus Hydrogenedens sp.]HOL19034.1 DNA repair protein RecN [Candidatus Hydrogenedens sp.]HPP57784.1 DNA repair protein RecN [Candidatus Hydrogenedens sp.]
MLESLYIKDFALIDKLEIQFSDGLNILTGETGAGKSIIVEALQMALGERASIDVIRSGADKARVDAVFHISTVPNSVKVILEEYEIELDDDRLILSRVISSDGRSKAWLSGRPVPVNVLLNLGNELVDFHGQHEHQSVLKPICQLELLDSYADALTISESVKKKYNQIKKIEDEIRTIEELQKRQNREIELLKHELNEIEQVNPTIGEDEELKDRLAYVTNLENIRKSAREVVELLTGSEISILTFLNRVQMMVGELKKHDSSFESYFNQLEEIQCELNELNRECERCTNLVEISDEEIEQLNQRLNQINRLKRKYGNSIEEVLEYAKKARSTLEAVLNSEEKLEELKQTTNVLYEDITREAEILSKRRREGAEILSTEVTRLLKDLGMKEAVFRVKIEPCPLNQHGIEQIEFLLTPNLGENEKVLRQIASGGEISRIMLALKTVLTNVDQVPTLIFDEIDAGVGGIVARSVAHQLAELAKYHQVIVITHLPQIAVMGKTHFQILKEIENERTVTKMKLLQKEDRIKEIARMLDGSVSEISLKHANELLKEMQKKGVKSNG